MTPLCPVESWWSSDPCNHPGDDLHVPAGMGLESRSWEYDIVVVDQQPVVLVFVVVMVAEREGVRSSHLVPRSSEVSTNAAAAIAPMRCGLMATRSRAHPGLYGRPCTILIPVDAPLGHPV
jgi:hypothetical protein